MNVQAIDQKALKLVKNFKKAEAELLEVIMKVDEFKVYRKFRYASLFQYCVQRLKLSESQSYAFMAVARKSRDVPEIKESIEEGKLSVSKAKRITSVVTKENHAHWIELASSNTQRKVEREVALAQPLKAVAEKLSYLSPLENVPEKVEVKKNFPRVKMEVGLSEKSMILLRRAQDVVSQKKRRSVNLEQTLEVLIESYLEKNDPLEKAKRQKVRGKLNSSKPSSRKVLGLDEKNNMTLLKEADRKVPKENSNKIPKQRKPLPAFIKHQVYLKSGGSCAAVDKSGQRCQSRRFLEIHHIHPLSEGGSDELENLTLLCSGHHAVRHSG